MGAQFAEYCTNGLVRTSGDLDAGARVEAFDACRNSAGFAVVLDLSELDIEVVVPLSSRRGWRSVA
jgi:hypothetical protein